MSINYENFTNQDGKFILSNHIQKKNKVDKKEKKIDDEKNNKFKKRNIKKEINNVKSKKVHITVRRLKEETDEDEEEEIDKLERPHKNYIIARGRKHEVINTKDIYDKAIDNSEIKKRKKEKQKKKENIKSTYKIILVTISISLLICLICGGIFYFLFTRVYHKNPFNLLIH